jgi:putative ABC transport system permease protein
MASVAAVTSGFDGLAKLELLAGRQITANDSAVAVVAEQLARDFARDSSPDGMRGVVGDSLLIGGARIAVVGVLKGSVGPSQRGLVIPFKAASAVKVSSRFPSLVLRARRVEDVPALDQGVRRILASRHSNAADRFAIQTYRGRAEQAAQGIFIFKLLMGAITGISLIVGGIGIMNVLLAAVSERTREIGIRRASGARRADITWQFLAESVTISGIGAVIGLVLGLVGAYAVTALIRRFAQAAFIHASFSWSSLLVAAVLSVAIGLAFGTYPARRAANLSPIDAIRHE